MVALLPLASGVRSSTAATITAAAAVAAAAIESPQCKENGYHDVEHTEEKNVAEEEADEVARAKRRTKKEGG